MRWLYGTRLEAEMLNPKSYIFVGKTMETKIKHKNVKRKENSKKRVFKNQT